MNERTICKLKLKNADGQKQFSRSKKGTSRQGVIMFTGPKREHHGRELHVKKVCGDFKCHQVWNRSILASDLSSTKRHDFKHPEHYKPRILDSMNLKQTLSKPPKKPEIIQRWQQTR